MATERRAAGNSKPRRPPATTPEAREQQLQSYAYDLAENRLLEGTASAQEIIYFLRASSIREKVELERLRKDNLLTEAKIDQASAGDKMEGLLREALTAFTEYSGQSGDDEDEF